MSFGNRCLGQGALVVAFLVGLPWLAGCPAGKGAPVPKLRAVKLATTTSTENSGLLKSLLPPFTERYGVGVKVIAVGTGRAIKLAENGDVDLILVHAPGAEAAFIAKGHGVNRRRVMHNDFVLIGPAADPAGIRGGKDGVAALRRIAAKQALFVSRGDESGTHKKEQNLWKAAGLSPKGRWYRLVGQGMGRTLMWAEEKRAYTLTDRGTWLAYRSRLKLPILVQGDRLLNNPYSVIVVNPARHPHVRYIEAMMLAAWLTSKQGQGTIRGYKKQGQLLFHPDAIPGR